MENSSREDLEMKQPLPVAPQTPAARNRVQGHLSLNRINRSMLLAVLVVVAAGSWLLWHYYALRESTDDALIDGNISPVAARVSGTVVAVNVSDNQLVQAGTVLVQLDPRDYRVALAQAEANLASAIATSEAARTGVPVESIATASQVSTTEAALRLAEGGVAAAARDVDSAQARLDSARARQREAQANYTRAQQDLERYKKLIGKDEISQQQYDTAATAAAAARAVRDSAEALVDEADKAVGAAAARLNQAQSVVSEAQAAIRAASTAPQQVRISKAQASSADARVQQARAAVEEAQLHVEYTSVKAPVTGWVTGKTVQIGQVVQEGQGLLAIVPLEDIWVTAQYKETQLKNIRPGQRAQIRVDAYGRTYNGYVDSIAAATGERFSLLPPENASGNFVKVVQRVPVKIALEKGQDPEHLLRIGLSVEPTIIIR